MMQWAIRNADVHDAEKIARVHVESWRSTYAGIVPDDFLSSLDIEARTENWKEWLDRSDVIVLVAEDRSGIFGFAGGGSSRGEPAGYEAEIYAIYLCQQYQRCGIGADLLHRLTIELQKQNFKSAAVWVLERNPACAFYARLGGLRVAHKTIDIGGTALEEVAFAWQTLD